MRANKSVDSDTELASTSLTLLQSWHQMFLVRYPSPAAFRTMLSVPEYQACVRHRTAALADSRLTPITPYEA